MQTGSHHNTLPKGESWHTIYSRIVEHYSKQGTDITNIWNDKIYIEMREIAHLEDVEKPPQVFSFDIDFVKARMLDDIIKNNPSQDDLIFLRDFIFNAHAPVQMMDIWNKLIHALSFHTILSPNPSPIFKPSFADHFSRSPTAVSEL